MKCGDCGLRLSTDCPCMEGDAINGFSSRAEEAIACAPMRLFSRTKETDQKLAKVIDAYWKIVSSLDPGDWPASVAPKIIFARIGELCAIEQEYKNLNARIKARDDL